MSSLTDEIGSSEDELELLDSVATSVKAVRKEYTKADAEKALKEQQKRLEEQAKAAQQLQDIIEKTDDPHQIIIQDLEKQLELIDELEAKTGDVQQAEAARAAALRQFTTEQAALDAKAQAEREAAAQEELDSMLEDLQTMQEANDAAIAARMAAEQMAAEQAAVQRAEQNEAMIGATQETLAAISMLAAAEFDERASNAAALQMELDRLNEQGLSKFRASINARKDLTKDEKKARIQAERERLREERKVLRKKMKAEREAARKAFLMQKVSALLQITVNTAVAITQAVAQLGPIAGAIAGLGIGILGAAQAAIVARQQPTFHQGGIVTADLLPGEAVLDRSTTERIGPEGIRSLQTGGGVPPASSGSGGTERVSLRIGRLEAREIVRTDLRAGGEIVATVRDATTRRGPEVGMSGLGVLS